MSSFCVQYLAEPDILLGAFFTHDRSLDEVEADADAMAAEFGAAQTLRILDMGGGVHLFKRLDKEHQA